MIDNTLTILENNLPSKEELHTFCEMLFTIGVDIVEIPVEVYKVMKSLPEHQKFILNIEYVDEMKEYPGFFRYICRYKAELDKLIYELQLNDIREIVKLRTLQVGREYRVVGLDDLMCYDSYEKFLEEILHCLPNSSVIFNPENSYGCASALAMQWAAYYGNYVTTSFAGCKNNAATEEVLMALRLAIRHKPNRDLTILPRLTRLYEQFTGQKTGNRKPIIGKNIFQVEAGIHVDAIKKNPATYEAYDPKLVGKYTELVIGKHSGTKAIVLKMEELGLPVMDTTDIEKLLYHIKSICTQHRKSLSDEEFVRLVEEVSRNEGNEIHR
ncbi:MAG: hypothetical protein K0R00_3137 [Herbinix sp.]|nr:hypothetical protein [Herbinix sp.]